MLTGDMNDKNKTNVIHHNPESTLYSPKLLTVHTHHTLCAGSLLQLHTKKSHAQAHSMRTQTNDADLRGASVSPGAGDRIPDGTLRGEQRTRALVRRAARDVTVQQVYVLAYMYIMYSVASALAACMRYITDRVIISVYNVWWRMCANTQRSFLYANRLDTIVPTRCTPRQRW